MNIYPFQQSVGQVVAPQESGELEAFLKGAQGAKDVPTAASAIARGITSGFDAYNKETEALQIQEENRNKLELQAINLKKAKATEDLNTQVEIEKGKAELTKLSKETELITKKKELLSALTSDNDEVKKTALNPEFAEVLAADPNLQEQVVGHLASKGLLTPEQKDNYTEYKRLNVQKDFDAAIQRVARGKLGEYTEKFIADVDMQQLMRSSGLDINDPTAYTKFLGGTTFLKSGQFVYDKASGGFVRDPDAGDWEAPKGYDAFDVNGRKLNPDSAPIDTASAQAAAALQNELVRSGGINPKRGPLPAPISDEAPATTAPAPAAATEQPKVNPLTGEPAAAAPAAAPAPQAKPTTTTTTVPGTNPATAKEAEIKNEILGKIQANPKLKELQKKKAAKYSQTSSIVSELNPFRVNEAEAQELASKPVKPSAAIVSIKTSLAVVERINNEPLLQGKPAIVKAIAAQESGGKRNAQSPTGVRGLMQVTEGTAKPYGGNRDNPVHSVKIGEAEFNRNLIRFGADYRLALAAYNAGTGAITDAIKRAGSYEWEDVKLALADTLSARKLREVTQYPDHVLRYAAEFVDPTKSEDRMLLWHLNDMGLIE